MHLAQQLPLWTGASTADVASVLHEYNVSACVPASAEGAVDGVDGSAGAVACCKVVDELLIDAAMRCPAHRGLTAYAKHR
jgi:hypothetical protein